MFSLGWTSNGNPLPGAGLGSNPTSNIGVSIAQELPAPGKLRLRGEIASKDAEAEFQQYQAVKLSVIARLKLAYHQLHHAYEAAEIMRREQKLLGNFMQISESRYSVGKAAQQDIFRAHAQFAIMETQIVRMEQDKPTQQAIINSLVNRPQDTPVDAACRNAAGRTDRHARRTAGARAHRRAGRHARPEDGGAQRTRPEPGAQGLFARLRSLGRLLQPGRHGCPCTRSAWT